MSTSTLLLLRRDKSISSSTPSSLSTLRLSTKKYSSQSGEGGRRRRSEDGRGSVLFDLVNESSITSSFLSAKVNYLLIMIVSFTCLMNVTSLTTITQVEPEGDDKLLINLMMRLNVIQIQLPDDQENGIETVDSDYYDSIPTSFAVLINFGLDGQQRSLYSSYAQNKGCHSKQIWDPFNKQCRQLFCQDNYEIRNLQCVESNEQHMNSNSSTTERPNLKFLDAASKFINVTLVFWLNETKSGDWIQENQNRIRNEFIEVFAISWSIEKEQIIDIELNYNNKATVSVIEIDFLLVEDLEKYKKKVDEVLKPLSDSIVSRTLHYTIVGLKFQALHIHTTLAEVNNFCLKDSDMPIWYWNEEFTIINNGSFINLYVGKTGRIYKPGEFMSSVLYVENKSGKNVSSNAVVCEQTLIDENCPRILYNRSEYEFVNGSKLYTNDKRYHDRYELTDNASVFVCLPGPSSGNLHVDTNDKIQSILSLVLMIISITLLTIMLITFIRLASIRRTVNGFNTINLVLCLEVMQITFLANHFIDYCYATAPMFHFFILTTISWSWWVILWIYPFPIVNLTKTIIESNYIRSVIAFDMYQVFARKKNLLLTGRPNTSYIRVIYGLVAYLIPLLIVAVAELSDIFGLEAIDADYGHVVHSSNFCWMRARRAIILYFIFPVAVAQVFNLSLYLCIICNIRTNIRSFTSFRKVVVRIPSGSSQTSSISVISSSGTESTTASSTAKLILTTNEVKLNYNQTSIYTKLSVPLGFTWAIALFSPLIPSNHSVIILIMSYLFIIANTSQGVVLFFAFGVYRKMFATNSPR